MPPDDPQRRSGLAVVTGASSGIGRAIAIALARQGYRTVLVARRRALLEELARHLRTHAPSDAVALDLADSRGIAPAVAHITATHGPASVLVNNAGFGAYVPFLEQDPDEFQRLMRVNFEAAVRMTRALLPGMVGVAAHGGAPHVFNVCSMSARMGPWGHAGYAASKGAMRSFTEVLHAEHRGDGVRCTAVYPGIVGTEYFEKGTMKHLWPRVARRAVSPDVVADAVVASIGRERLAVYVPSHYRVLDWIAAVSPRAASWLVRRESAPRGATLATSGPTPVLDQGSFPDDFSR